jgi:hypothetical protein
MRGNAMSPQREREQELDQLREELHQLARRVDALERHALEPLASTLLIPVPAGAGQLPGDIQGTVPNMAGTAGVIGRAILGLAGAYLLRAAAETGTAPRAVAALGVLYAFAWLLWAFRALARSQIAGTTFALTSALILMPLLWESSVRFGTLAPAATATILFVFFLMGLFGPEFRATGPVCTNVSLVCTSAALLTSLILMVATGDLLPFDAALLGAAAVVELRAAAGKSRGLRVIAAIGADAAIGALLLIENPRGGWPEQYRPIRTELCIGLVTALAVLYSGSVAWNAAVKRVPMLTGEIVQVVVTWLLAIFGTLRATHSSGAPALGGICALACGACYLTAFWQLAEGPRRNHVVLGGWGLGLALASCALLLSPLEAMLIWSAGAVVALGVGSRLHRTELIVHGDLYLLAAMLVSALPLRFAAAFTGERLEPASLPVWVAAISAACCYAACLAATRDISPRASVLPALILAASAGSLLVLTVAPWLGENSLAAFRTVVICVVALGLAFAGSRASRRELIWISYAAIAFGAIKLALQDLRRSTPAALAVSLVFYGLVLILAPKLGSRAGARA